MEALKCLIESMEKELCAAKCYYMKSIHHKDSTQQISNTYSEIASQELEHFTKFYSATNTYINRKKSEGADISVIDAIWEYEHTKLLDEYNELKYKISKVNI